ncbi:VMAP-C domain-containing protein [Streptomyces mirabilis]
MNGPLDPERVFALVVGIESYRIPGWSLPGPARDADRFADWLCGPAGVPEAQVRVLLSPLDQSLAQSRPPATAENVHRVLYEELPQCDGDLLWIYWAGHGFINDSCQLLLPYADATTDRTRHLNLQAALHWWRSSRIPGRRFHRVVAVGDTCRIEAKRAKKYGFGTDKPDAGELNIDRRQFVLFAAQLGQAAKNQAERQAGQFTHTFLKHLAGQTVSKTVEGLVGIAQAVQADFAEMRKNGEAWQEPQFVIDQGFDESTLFGDRWTNDTTGALSEPAGAQVLDQDAWTELGQLLTELGELLTVGTLPAYTYDAYRWAFEVTGCAIPPGDALPAERLLDIVRDLDSRQGRRLDFPLTLPFVCHLAARAKGSNPTWAAEAEAWVDRTRDRLGAAPIPPPPGPTAERPTLHVRLMPDPDDDSKYWSHMWLYRREFESVWESSQPLDLKTVQDELAQQLAACSHTPTRVEFHVPWTLLDEPFESWPVPVRDKTAELGCRFEVVLRCPDERQGIAEIPWKVKWAWLKAQGGQHPKAVRELFDSDVSDDLSDSLQETEPPVAVLAEVTEPLIKRMLDAVLDGGVPIAIWRRQADSQDGMAVPIRTALAEDPAPFDIQTLPARLRTARIKRRPLVLMWDDPGRIPERQTLIS